MTQIPALFGKNTCQTTLACAAALAALLLSGCTSPGTDAPEAEQIEVTAVSTDEPQELLTVSPLATIQRDPSVPVESIPPLKVTTVPAAPTPASTTEPAESALPQAAPTGLAGRCVDDYNRGALMPPPEQLEDPVVLAFLNGDEQALRQLRSSGAGSPGDERYQWMLTGAIRANCTSHVDVALRFGAQPWRLVDGDNLDPITAALVYGTPATLRSVLAASSPALSAQALTSRLFVAGCRVSDANTMLALEFGAKRTLQVGDTTETLDGIRAQC